LPYPGLKKNIPAIHYPWDPGEQGGTAIAEVLFGKVNPSGKLNVSFPQSVGHLPVFYNYYPTDKGYYNKRGTLDSRGKDYVFSNPDPLWAFGTGLSYTSFDMKQSMYQNYLLLQTNLSYEVTVKNTGNMDGKEVVQLYVRDKVSSVVTPVRELKDLKSIYKIRRIC
jgi:beta-glucosidase